MKFRPAVAADIDDVVSLQAAYYRDDGYPHDPAAARSAWADLLADGRLGRAWVVDGPPGVVGYVVVTFGYSLEYLGRDAFIDELYLADGYRGRGLGRTALQLAEVACREAGVRVLHLEVEADKLPAIELYRRRGFVDHRRFLMTKQLSDLGT